MKRWILGTLAGVSCVLMLAAIVLWIGSLGAYHNFRFERTHDVADSRPTWECFDLTVNGGFAQVSRMRMSNSPNGPLPPGWTISNDRGPKAAEFPGGGRLGFAYYDRIWNASARIERRTTSLAAPLWFVTLASGIGPALWARGVMRRRRRASRRRRGLCVGCGYDLRASSGACPECGLEQPPLQQQTRA